MARFGFGNRPPRHNRFGDEETIVRLYDSGRGGLKGVVTINGQRFKLFVTRANTPKKENHTHWCAISAQSGFSGGGFNRPGPYGYGR